MEKGLNNRREFMLKSGIEKEYQNWKNDNKA